MSGSAAICSALLVQNDFKPHGYGVWVHKQRLTSGCRREWVAPCHSCPCKTLSDVSHSINKLSKFNTVSKTSLIASIKT